MRILDFQMYNIQIPIVTACYFSLSLVTDGRKGIRKFGTPNRTKPKASEDPDWKPEPGVVTSSIHFS